MAEGLKLLATILGILLVCSLIATGYAFNKPAKIEQVEKIVTINTYNDTALQNKVDALSSEVLKDSNWKVAAEKMATNEGPSQKDIYNFLSDNSINIEEKEDIKSALLKETEIISFDSEDRDAVVEQEYKVYYEDADEVQNFKVYLIVTTEIVDNEVVDQTIEFK